MHDDQKTGLFWLHIKKSAGISTRKMLQPLYKEVDRTDRPACFIQSAPEDHNDILNNYRVVLGDYQFRRCLFASKFLYGGNFHRLLRVAFSRNPVDRCVSQFFYLWHKPPASPRIALRRRLGLARRFVFRDPVDYDFDRFLTAIEACRASPSNHRPHGLQFQTHTAAMWDDVVDESGNLLLDLVFRLEDLGAGVNEVRTRLGHEPLRADQTAHVNKSAKVDFVPSPAQKRRIEALFGKDFDIYEGIAARR